MRYIFAKSSDRNFLAYGHSTTIYLPESQTGWSAKGEKFATADDWLGFVHHKLLELGITDVQCRSRPPAQNSKQAHNFEFYFLNEWESYEFQMAILPDLKKDHHRKITSLTRDQSARREHKIKSFLYENEIDGAIKRHNDLEFTVTTSCRYDDLIIALHLSKRKFDNLDTTAQRSHQKPRLFLSYEKMTERSP